MGCNSNVMNTELLANAISDNAKQMNQLPVEKQCKILSFHTISIDWPSFSQKNKYDVYVDNKNCSSFIWCRTDKIRTDNAKSQVIYLFNFGCFQNVFFCSQTFKLHQEFFSRWFFPWTPMHFFTCGK